MKVLVGCEYSGRVRSAFRAKGHDAWSCDLLPSDDSSEFHFQGDIFEMLKQEWDMAIFFPPCTYLCNSGVMWLDRIPGRRDQLKNGAEFFKKLLECRIPRIAIENPIMHKYAKEIIGTDQSQIIQPWMFGHTEQKATCLWLKNLPLLKETNNVKNEMMKLSVKERQRIHYLPPSKDRWKIRSKTYQGIADALADQYSRFLESGISVEEWEIK